jgi:hypothetical protein
MLLLKWFQPQAVKMVAHLVPLLAETPWNDNTKSRYETFKMHAKLQLELNKPRSKSDDRFGEDETWTKSIFSSQEHKNKDKNSWSYNQ